MRAVALAPAQALATRDVTYYHPFMRPGPKPISGKAMTPAERQARYRERQKIEVGSGMDQVSSVMYWHVNGHFESKDEAKGAFKFAYQQGIDGMGVSVRLWMGLTEQQYATWMRDGTLPKGGGLER